MVSGIWSFCHFSSCSGFLYDLVGVLLEVFLELAPLSAFSRILSSSLQSVLSPYSLPRFGGVGRIEVGCVDVGGVGDVVCVSFWWLREPGWSKRSSAREVEGGVAFVGVDQLWVVVGWGLCKSSGDHCASGLGGQRRLLFRGW